jgi:hypothetical protein
MLTKCPHCFRGVVPYDDGRCPSCQKNVRDLKNADTSKTRIVVDEATAFPSVCCTCGTSTNRSTKVRRLGEIASGMGARRVRSYEPSVPMQIFLFMIFGLISVLFFFARSGEANRARASMRVRIPQCKNCYKASPVKPEMVDLEHHRFGFVVHRKFAELVNC